MMIELPSHVQVQFLQLLSLGKPKAAKALHERWVLKMAREHQEQQEEDMRRYEVKQQFLGWLSMQGCR